MNANDIIEKCACACERAGKEIDEGSLTASRIASECAHAIRTLKSSLPAEKYRCMTEEQIKHLVDRFLQWRLPKNFNPDAGISYKRPNYAPEIDETPSGTNLFDAAQATEMVRFMIEGLPSSSHTAESEAELAAKDAALSGTAFMQDGKRIDPAEVYSLLAETVSEATLNEACAAYEAAFVHGDNNWRNQMRAALAHVESDNARLQARVAELEAAQGWRPISEAPKYETRFLAFIANGSITAAQFISGKFFAADRLGSGDTRPTHFMPIPAPPVGDR